MDTESKKQYMETLREKYFKANKKEKKEILDEYCERTGEGRKYAIKKFNYKVKIKNPDERKKRSQTYKGNVVSVLVELWNIFERPCGQRLKPLINDEIDKLRKFKEIHCSDDVTISLKKMSSSTIDRRLKHEKEVLALNLKHNKKKSTPLLSQVPVKTSADMDRSETGEIQLDCVEHNGASVAGEYLNSLTTIDINFGWWEGESLMGKSQRAAFEGIKNCKSRFPVNWNEMHPDNGDNILNWHILKYAKEERIELSRSRSYKKNDNCFVEQKNSTHVRKPFGYLRFDTVDEQEIMNDLYRNELRLFKNFFQPVMKLKEKIRIKGKQHRKYDNPQTPYQRIMKSNQVDKKTKKELKGLYDSLNPAELRRSIDSKIKKLYDIYQTKNGSKKVDLDKKLSASLVSYYMIHQL